MKKLVFILIIAVLTLPLLCACGNAAAIAGTWKYVSGGTGTFGDFGMDYTITLRNGTMTLSFDEQSSDLTGEELELAKTKIQVVQMNAVRYDIVSDTKIKLTVTFLGDTQIQTMPYELRGDTLMLNGAVFERQK